MRSDEVFYLHIEGEQRGPYTVLQINHLVNSGLISEDTMFWREGLEQWAPVRELVIPRKRVRRWVRPAVALAILVVLLIVLRLFGPITMVGWREASQSDFSAEAAYWRARDMVRSQALPGGAVVLFQGFSSARVELHDRSAATVLLTGDVTASGKKAERMAWKVELVYDERLKQWTGKTVRPAPLYL